MRGFKFGAWIPDIERLYHVISLSSENVLVWEHPCAKTAKIKNKKGVFRLGDGVEIMQYTGIKDKNGVEIYEGDIVQWGENIETVFYDSSEAYFTTETSLIDSCMEVIGNIYENKELLK